LWFRVVWFRVVARWIDHIVFPWCFARRQICKCKFVIREEHVHVGVSFICS
jgi:hypothetical protein